MPQAPLAPATAPKRDWKALEADPTFARLVRARRRFTVPACAVFILYYFALPVLVGFWPEVMEREIVGKVNLAYLFALSEFGLAWLIMALYVRRARAFDRLAAEIAACAHPAPSSDGAAPP